MIDTILPDRVVFREAFGDEPEAVLFAEETALVTHAVDKRRREFTTGRHCARAALALLGFPPAPILKGERGAPVWPPGVVGSITHCAGYRAAAVSVDVLSIGIDAEPALPLPDGILETISLPGERDMLTRLGGGQPWDRLLFSAKESVYKAWFPLARRRLDFADARIGIDPDGGFTARLLVPGPHVGEAELRGFTGRWLVADGLLMTAVTVPGH
ncbi:4'-phosphopantetheinyl transferase superfamily protein [Microtetraspora sp. NBRC 16547]|uniref:4'-phosphopantetheinyl transferase family protein n=1 Tax=Microtetraspora sp. NBRC 16547 TaxID=3030993 RepID=UPI0024A5EEE0|nr:4'-phosphopantetheinyl transferase superfamily protein [Microtetraspora sp. NBRC 16547]GLW99279.1 4'-phosphopantetheinyl transferase [Microtetraspora sp. NBRC 16547]